MAGGRGALAAEGLARRHERDMERLERLRPIDDDFMRVLYRGDAALTEETLRIVTGLGDLVVVEQDTQHDLRRLAGARSVELDVWAVDSSGRWHDIEVQRGVTARPRRARYHSAAMDVEALGAGEEPEGLPEQWVVFIMEGDPFGSGRGRYEFGRVDGTDGRPLGDGSHVLYVNGAYRGDDDLGRLMHDFCESDPDAMLNALMAERVRYFKRTPRGEAEMCEVFDEIREEGIEIGIEQGVEQGIEKTLVEGVRSLMSKLGVTAQEALRLLGVPESGQAHYLSML